MSIEEKSQSILNSFILNSFAGSIGGIAQVLCGQPFDIVKVRMQNQSSANPLYKNAADCVKSIYHKEGLLAFYKGTVAPLSGVALCVSVQFGLNELFKNITEQYNHKHHASSSLTSLQYYMCGGFVGLGNCFISTPVEHIRIRLQNQRKESHRRYTGSYDAFIKIKNEYGIRALYKGLSSTMCRDIIAFAIFFGIYETFKRKYTKKDDSKRIPICMAIGCASSVVLWAASYPFDVIKTIHQSDCFDNPKFFKTMEIIRHIYKNDGLYGFTKGFLPCVIRAPFVFAGTILAYELSLSIISTYNFT
ncbi:unnamed protein product [Moneuplotes crassus]|uniref:Mitochondrial carrier protein n=1 Tax=Euplotes crassus TaxID=5936 RepID=A0AAD1XPY4_EUPCR|nr:unnamed protein product [Moneuplotes crassus]